MPLREYECSRCSRRFEALSREGEELRCPTCQATTGLNRLLSTFAVAGGGDRAASAVPSGCGSCGDPRGPGSCARN